MELVLDTLSALGRADRQAGKEAAVAGGQAPLREAAAARRKGQKRQLLFTYQLHGGVVATLCEVLGCFPGVKGDLGSGNREDNSGV